MKKLPSVAVNTKPKVSDVIPTIDGKDKSISPRVTTNVAEIAMIPKKRHRLHKSSVNRKSSKYVRRS